MKLRLKKNSVRLRLTQNEVELFSERGLVEEYVDFADGVRFRYRLMSDETVNDVTTKFDKQGITVILPGPLGRDWTASEMVGIEGKQATRRDELHIVVEKDFACLDHRPGDDDDTFPNPLRCAS